MYRRILLAFDGSPDGRAALAEGIELAGLYKAEVHLLAVLRLMDANGFGEGIHPLESFAGGDVAHLRALVDQGLNQIRQHNIPNPKGHIAFGQPLEQIPRLARNIGADLIVVGHRHRGMLERWWQGSLSTRLLDQVECSVLIAVQPS